MSELPAKELRFAVLIDADNVPATHVAGMMEEISKYGTPTFKRIYGDWTNQSLSGWKKVLNEHAINPIQQFAYTTGKNATDSALIIDAMDILHTHRVDGFFIVSSDSDFTRLATRLREEGLRVLGMGEKKTPPAFIKACDKFIYLEILGGKTAAGPRQQGGAAKKQAPIDPQLEDLLRHALDDLADEDDWVSMGRLGNGLLRMHPDFDPRNYGYKKLSDLVSALSFLEVKHLGPSRQLFVRLR